MELKDLLKDNYKEGMTVEDIEAALKDVTLPEDKSDEIEKLKEAVTKSNHEAAEWKKKHNALLSEDEANKQKEKEEHDQLLDAYNKLLRDSTVSKNKSNLLAMGYEDGLAEETAIAMVDGNLDKVFANQKKHLDAFEKQIRAEALKVTPKPTGDGNSELMTLETLRAMSPQERLAYSKEHPTEYHELYAGGNE